MKDLFGFKFETATAIGTAVAFVIGAKQGADEVTGNGAATYSRNLSAAKYVTKAGGDETLQIATLLHDAVSSREQVAPIAKIFGDEVYSLIIDILVIGKATPVDLAMQVPAVKSVFLAAAIDQLVELPDMAKGDQLSIHKHLAEVVPLLKVEGDEVNNRLHAKAARFLRVTGKHLAAEVA